jgi:single-strand DNA-binding protein
MSKSEDASGGGSDVGVNIAVVAGVCSAPPDVRVLPSGSTVANLAVTAPRGAGEPATSVPVAVWSPAAWVERLDEGDSVIVVGRIRRRFWRAGAVTASRVELEAEAIARGTDRRRLPALLRRATDALADLEP